MCIYQRPIICTQRGEGVTSQDHHEENAKKNKEKKNSFHTHYSNYIYGENMNGKYAIKYYSGNFGFPRLRDEFMGEIINTNMMPRRNITSVYFFFLFNLAHVVI